MTKMELGLPPALQAFVDEQAARHGFAEGSDYVEDLIRKQRDREALRATLLAGAESELAEPADEAYFEALRARIRTRARRTIVP